MSRSLRLCCCLAIVLGLRSSVLPAQLPTVESIPQGHRVPVAGAPGSVSSLPMLPVAATIAPPPGEVAPPTTATLRVHVVDGATVTINRHETKTQKYSGGSRLFTLTGLDPWQPTKVVVEARLEYLTGPRSTLMEVEIEPGKSHKISLDLIPVVAPAMVQADARQVDTAAGRENASAALTAAAARLEAAGTTVDTAKTQFNEDLASARQQFNEQLDAAKMQFAADAQQSLQTTKQSLDDYAAEMKDALEMSIEESLTASENKLAELTTGADTKINALISRLETAASPFLADGAPIAGRTAPRVYKIQSKDPLQATLSYNANKEINGLQFVDETVNGNAITFLDGNQWNAAEVAKGGELQLQLAVRCKDANGNVTIKPFGVDQPRTETIAFESLDNRSAQLAWQGNGNLQNWMETMIAGNEDRDEKFTLADQVSAILITGKFALGFAEAVELSEENALEIEILR